MKKSVKIAETGLGSYISSAITGFFVGALPRQRDDFNFFTRSEALPSYSTVAAVSPADPLSRLGHNHDFRAWNFFFQIVMEDK